MSATESNESAESTFATYGEHIDEGQRGTLVVFDKPSAEERAMLVLPYTFCPNVADLLDQSNWGYIKRELSAVDPDGNDHRTAAFGHWFTPYDLMLVKAGSEAHRVAERLMASYANHPVLDESDFSDRETQAFSDDLAGCINGLTIELDGAEVEGGTAAYDRLFCVLSSELTESESRDSCNRSDVEQALRDLGFTYDESEFTWRGSLPSDEPPPSREQERVHVMQAPLVVVNPSERSWQDQRYVLSFGAAGTTHLLVWGNLDDALETAAEWLCEHAPGHVMLKGNGADKRDPELDELMSETCEELGLAWPIPDDIDGGSDAMQPYWDAEQQAFADLTECEHCYLTSHEWCITLENPTRSELKSFISELAERHYSDGPVCDITRPQARPIPSGRYVNVSAHHSDPGKGLSYGDMRVRLVDPCETEGWDVIDVILPDGSEGSVYSFSVTR